MFSDGANGLAFDADDRLFVASVMGPEVVVMDPRTGRILERSGPEGGVLNPDDVAFGPTVRCTGRTWEPGRSDDVPRTVRSPSSLSG